MASTGSAGKVVSGIEATDSESQSTTKPNETPRRQYLMKRLVDEDQFGAGFYGTYFSIFILVIGMVGAVLGLNFAPMITLSSWTSDCKPGFFSACKSSGAVLRFSFALSSIFFIQLVGTTISSKFYDYLWGLKFLLFCGLVILFYFLQAEIFDLNGYAWYARVAGFFYLIIQQIILLDFAYTWNERIVKWSDEDAEHGYGKAWLVLLIFISFIFIGGSLTIIGVMYWQFGNPICSDTLTILSLTLGLCFIATFIQVFISDEGSMLTSAIIIAYSTYICYSAVTLNPNPVCNPTLTTRYQTVSQVIGMCITITSFLWGSSTSLQKIKALNADTETVNSTSVKDTEISSPYGVPGLKFILQESCLVSLLVSSYFAMVLTNWATIQSNFSLQSAKQGTAAMWIQAAGQWIAIIFYIWSLVAPKLFPDRDFGRT